MTKKVLITGASGLLGRAVVHEFEHDGSWKILGLAFSRTHGKLRKVDITDQQAVDEVMQEFMVNYFVIIYNLIVSILPFGILKKIKF